MKTRRSCQLSSVPCPDAWVWTVLRDKRFCSFLSSLGLACVARVPIHLPRYVHHDCQHDEKRDRAHEQRIILLPQSNVQKRVNTRESGPNHQCPHTAAEEKSAIARNQQRRCNSRDQICPNRIRQIPKSTTAADKTSKAPRRPSDIGTDGSFGAP